MNRSVALAAIPASLAVLAVTGCSDGFLFGQRVEKAYDFAGFSRVEVSSAFRYEIKQSESFGVAISTFENDVSTLDVRLEGNRLIVARKPISGAHGVATAKITMPKLDSLTVSGASSGSARGFASESPWALDLSGASKLDMDMQTGDATIHVSGASRLTGKLMGGRVVADISGASDADLEGSAPSATIQVTGASELNAPHLLMQSATLNVTGASDTTVNASAKLAMVVSGTSTVNYLGNPTVTQDVTGNSTVHHK